MNILMLTFLDAGGVSSHIIDLGMKIMEQDPKSKVIVCYEEGGEMAKLSSYFETYKLKFHSKNPIRIIKTLIGLNKIIKSNNIDVVHCHYRSNALYMKVLSCFTGVKFVWTNHLLPISHDFIHRALTFYGEKAIAIGLESQRFLIDDLRIPEKDTQIIYHGVDLNIFNYLDKNKVPREKFGISENTRVVVLLSSLYPHKGHKFLLDSLKDVDNLSVVFTGTGTEEYRRELDEHIGEIGFKSEVIFTGFVKPDEILSVADVMVLPSEIEGFPISILESFAMKVPVVRTKASGYEDTKDYCYGVDFGDTKMLKDAIEKALDSKGVQPMVESAYKKVLEEWNKDAMARTYMKLYEKCIAPKQ